MAPGESAEDEAFSLSGPDPGKGGWLAAPCPKRRWLKAWSGDEGSGHPATRWQGAEEAAAGDAGTAMRAGHPPLARGAVSHLEERIPPPSAVTGLFCICSVRKREEFYCGCTEELSQEVALWLAGPGVERKASQMQHIVSLAALYSTAASRSGCKRCSAKELKSFFF